MFVITEIIKVIITDILLLVLKVTKFNSILLSYNVICFCAKKRKRNYIYISPARLKIWDLILSASR